MYLSGDMCLKRTARFKTEEGKKSPGKNEEDIYLTPSHCARNAGEK